MPSTALRRVYGEFSDRVGRRRALTGCQHLATHRLQTLDRAERRWRAAPPRNERIDTRLRLALDRAGIEQGTVLEIGGRGHPRYDAFDMGRFSYVNLDLQPGPDTVVGDITDCPQIADASYDVVVSVDVFEHITRPWLAAAEMTRILAPGGVVFASTLFSWRYHPCPVDYWRYTPEALKFLFEPLECLDSGFDLTERRRDFRKKAKADPMPIDEFGGWRENVRVYYAGQAPR